MTMNGHEWPKGEKKNTHKHTQRQPNNEQENRIFSIMNLSHHQCYHHHHHTHISNDRSNIICTMMMIDK